MNISKCRTTLLAATALGCALLQGCQTQKPSPIDELSLHEGLERVDSKTADSVFRRPDANMSTYSKLLLRPITVEFAKNWDPKDSGSALYEMHEPDREEIKTELAEVFAEVFRKELEKGGYPMVTQVRTSWRYRPRSSISTSRRPTSPCRLQRAPRSTPRTPDT